MTARRAAGTADGRRSPRATAAPFAFSADERWQLGALYGCIALLHAAGWGLILHYATDHPALVGLGLAAYLFGLRHAFDADHIAAVDDSVRILLRKGGRPLGVGFHFSLGHSTIVLGLAMGTVFAAAALRQAIPGLQQTGAIVGTGVSGVFLLVVGILNLLVLRDLVGAWRNADVGSHEHAHIDELLRKRGLINRLFGGRLTRSVERGWQMYPLRLLFGLGFDTASEISLLAMTAGASTGSLPVPAVLSLPLLFAAGMTLIDTTDGVLMCRAWDWARVDPLRRMFYNVTTTGLSVALALVIGAVELLQMLRRALDLRGPFFDLIGALDFGIVGYAIVAAFLMTWTISAALWKFGRVE